MVSLTLSMPIETRKLMKKFPEMNWSGFVRKTIEEKANKLKELEEIKQKFYQEEKEISDWSVKLQHASRKGRLDNLKKKGLI
jgi:hypothetical protein|tara:strand:+ start:1241 stop:1486 length:246 start_codon:yes stop_codon:yes gene_type:complete